MPAFEVNHPIRSPALARRWPRRGWLGLSLSTLCFIHCMAGAAIAATLPTAFAFLSENPALECLLLGISMFTSGRLVWRLHLGGSRFWRPAALWSAAGAIGLTGLRLENERLLQLAFAALALLQLWLFLRQPRPCRT
jgi:hypothetical protein